ncbi:SAM-dependent methyltransferase [Xenorhabdus sp. TS4]|uniref:class I SAM-dependent methyltransferase n=1 Tax=Xenorhabdus sp. TS4 TaxID=1873483 RepID=UPI0016570078|nr:SAM-dependent methyltransferase [Xenorhabdus sp. TS4]MBC8951087.1 putative S-adenosyl-L-methionine-dependent methyltransferase [Xenorhabdus sp. TS4]
MRYLLSSNDEMVPNPDNYGKYFVNGKWEKYLKDVDAAKSELQSRLPGCMYYHLIRTLKFDDSLIKWANSERNSQIVILGAGFDSRAMRYSELLDGNNISVYEIDLAAMLEFKKGIIDKHKLQPCIGYHYIPCNFNDKNLSGCMLAGGISKNKNTLILWEGVTYFLPDEIIQNTIIELRDFFKGKLQITLDYAFRDYIEGNLNFYGAKELYDVLVEISEPHFFGLNFNESEKYFANLGFTATENLTALMLESKYLRDGFGKSAGLPHVFNAMIDIVKEVKNER